MPSAALYEHFGFGAKDALCCFGVFTDLYLESIKRPGCDSHRFAADDMAFNLNNGRCIGVSAHA